MGKIKNIKTSGFTKDRTAAVPRDRILEAKGNFSKLNQARITDNFRKLHALSEQVYNGDGSWGKGCADINVFDNVQTDCSKPLMRMSYTRLSAYLGMLDCDHSGQYLQRAQQAALFLMREQKPDGYFPYYLEDSGWPLQDSYGIMYVTGFTVWALLDMYDYCGDTRCLDSAYRACLWGIKFPAVANYNYNSIIIKALVRLAVLLKEEKHSSKVSPSVMCTNSKVSINMPENLLGEAVARTLNNIIPGQQANGGYHGHNSHIWYHGIITRANCMILQALSPSDPTFQPILQSLIANINYMVINQSFDGSLYINYNSEQTAATYSFWVIDALFYARQVIGNAVDNLLSVIANHFLNEIELRPGLFYNPEKKVNVNCINNHMEGLALLHKMTREGF